MLFYTVVPVMWLGYMLWGTLLRTYPAAKVGPVSLLVPCCALGFAAAFVGEPFTTYDRLRRECPLARSNKYGGF